MKYRIEYTLESKYYKQEVHTLFDLINKLELLMKFNICPQITTIYKS